MGDNDTTAIKDSDINRTHDSNICQAKGRGSRIIVEILKVINLNIDNRTMDTHRTSTEETHLNLRATLSVLFHRTHSGHFNLLLLLQTHLLLNPATNPNPQATPSPHLSAVKRLNLRSQPQHPAILLVGLPTARLLHIAEASSLTDPMRTLVEAGDKVRARRAAQDQGSRRVSSSPQPADAAMVIDVASRTLPTLLPAQAANSSISSNSRGWAAPTPPLTQASVLLVGTHSRRQVIHLERLRLR
jgi:hypothetical protein